jgi:hypothetical protein
MTNVDLALNIRCGLFASRDTINEAMIYAVDVLSKKNNSSAENLTALYVVLNTISKTILENEKITENV